VAPALDDVAGEVAVAVARRHRRPAEDRDVELATVQMAGHGEVHARGHLREEVGVVHHEHDAITVAVLPQSGRKIG
jgi:hypothetical protein